MLFIFLNRNFLGDKLVIKRIFNDRLFCLLVMFVMVNVLISIRFNNRKGLIIWVEMGILVLILLWICFIVFVLIVRNMLLK